MVSELFWFFLKAFFAYRFFKSFCIFYRIFASWWLYPKLGWCLDLKNYAQQWVVVTGCTDGIGKAYTIELAGRGLKKFLLIARNPEKLSDVETLLRDKFSCEVETHVFDFATDHYDKLPDALTTYNIGILVNCVGVAVNRLQIFTDQPLGLATEIIRINAMSMAKMCDLVLPGMVKRDKGVLVNVSSIQGWRPLPMLSTYVASKACVSFLSESLHLEYKNTNVKIQCLMPSLVATKMTGYDAADGMLVVSPETYVKNAIDIIGVFNMTTGCIAHDVQCLMPSLVATKMTGYDAADGMLVVSPETYVKNAIDIIGVFNMTTGCIAHDVQAAVLSFLPYWLVKDVVKPFYAMQRKRLEAMAKNERNHSN